MTHGSRGQVLAVVRAAGPVTAAEIAHRLDLHVTTARFHLKHLAADGEVLAQALPARGAGRPSLAYAAAPSKPEARVLALLLGELGSSATDRVEAGRRVGHRWAAEAQPPRADGAGPAGLPDPAVVVRDALDRLGFSVSAVTSAFGAHDLKLCGCPLHVVVCASPEIATGIVWGVVQHALTRASAAFTEQYRVHVSPNRDGACEIEVHLMPASAVLPRR